MLAESFQTFEPPQLYKAGSRMGCKRTFFLDFLSNGCYKFWGDTLAPLLHGFGSCWCGRHSFAHDGRGITLVNMVPARGVQVISISLLLGGIVARVIGGGLCWVEVAFVASSLYGTAISVVVHVEAGLSVTSSPSTEREVRIDGEVVLRPEEALAEEGWLTKQTAPFRQGMEGYSIWRSRSGF